MQNVRTTLRENGLTTKEISLYLASLALGEAGITDLAAKAKLKKSTAYLVFESLQNKGLMGSFRTKSGNKFVATTPKMLVSKSEKQLESLKEIVPQLDAIRRNEEGEPAITYYHGKEGYFLAVQDTLKYPNTTVRHIGSLKEIHSVIGLDYDLKQVVPERMRQNIFLKALYYQSELSPEIRSLDDQGQLREIRFLPENFLCRTYTMIYEGKVAIVSSRKELVTIIIESRDIAEAERQKFELIWGLSVTGLGETS